MTGQAVDVGRAATTAGRVVAAFALLLLMAAGACGDGPSGVGPDEAPEGHTRRIDGVPHAPGLQTPETSCAACHGADLRGGDQGEPSCFSCHGRTW